MKKRLTLGLRSSVFGLFDAAALVERALAAAAAAAVSALLALAASFALCFSRLLSSLYSIIYHRAHKNLESDFTHCLEIISPVTGSLCVPAGAAASEDMLRQYKNLLL